MTTKEKMMEVMQAFVDGKQIQMRELCLEDREWITLSDGYMWDWARYDYRVKPEPKYRAYKDTDEMIDDYKQRFSIHNPPYSMPLVWIKQSESKGLVLRYGSEYVTTDWATFRMSELLNSCTYLDGSPIGKLVEE